MYGVTLKYKIRNEHIRRTNKIAILFTESY